MHWSILVYQSNKIEDTSRIVQNMWFIVFSGSFSHFLRQILDYTAYSVSNPTDNPGDNLEYLLIVIQVFTLTCPYI